MLVLRAHSEPETDPDHSVAASLAVRSAQTGGTSSEGTATTKRNAGSRAQAPKSKPMD